ncbi:HNH endonuclease [Salinibacterium sp. SWN167]|uniref:HNH endonuclease n=1 Tax=Salinibacterium sp. SWN167 TaxID=2792054 RepID=UPI0018CF034D|nr:HNH endonuclease [Salinibacterium sp. SWN167]MBH0082486.1 HNH endonuclease [Salinibacterium sp. SWN167]
MALNSYEQARLRLAIFADLEIMMDRNGGYASRDELVNFEIEGKRLGLIDYSRGIRNPIEFDSTLSVVTSAESPYSDNVGDDGLLRYSMRSGDPVGGDNRKLRVAMETRTPIILFEKLKPNVYVPSIPAFVIDEIRSERYFLIAAGEAAWPGSLATPEDEIAKRYVEQVVKRRVHQPVFRARVMIAYQRTCAVCRLAHPELLDAAHIVPDSNERGVARVNNGLALCKIHHAAFDRNLMGISPDYVVHVSGELLRESGGTMLKHAIQDMHNVGLSLPASAENYPSREALDFRFSTFIH